MAYGGGSELGEASFAYDVGNRTDSGADTGTGNRLTDFGDYTFTHDDEGRTLTKSKTGYSQTYRWSARSQLDSVTTVDAGDTTVVRYTYDGLGRRITRDGPGGFEEYLYDGDHVIAVLDDNQNVLRTFSYYPGVDKPHSVMTDSATYYYATDPTGSVIGLAEFDGASSVVNHYRYDVWGMPQGSVTEGAENPIRFKARWWDSDTELLDFRSRWYDPEIGRFISEDPIGLAGGINVFVFAGNDPVHGWDPYGLANEDTPCSQVQGADTCTLPSLHVNGSQSGDFSPLDAILYLLPEEPLRRRPLGTFRAGGKAAGGGSAGSAADTVAYACRPVAGRNSGPPRGGIGHCGIRIYNADIDILVQLKPMRDGGLWPRNFFTGGGPDSDYFAAYGADNFNIVSTSTEMDNRVLSSVGLTVSEMAGNLYPPGGSNRFVGTVFRRPGLAVPRQGAGTFWLHTPGLN